MQACRIPGMAAVSIGIAVLTARLTQAEGTDFDGPYYVFREDNVTWNAEEWDRELDWMADAGFSFMVLSNAGAYYRDWVGEATQESDPLSLCLAACDRRGIQVYLGLDCNYDWYARWDLESETSRADAFLSAILRKYRPFGSLQGWYIPHEVYVMWDEQGEFVESLYGELSRLCKRHDPEGLVVLSPFFILDKDHYLGKFRYAEPGEYADWWTRILSGSEIDIVALQDSGEHLSFYDLEQRRPFFEAMSQACRSAGVTLWGNVETGELHICSYEDYMETFGRYTHVNDPRTRDYWRCVPSRKAVRKVRFAREFGQKILTWGYQEYWDPARGKNAVEAYRAYLRAFQEAE